VSIVTSVGAPGTVSIASGGQILAFALTTTPQPVAAANPARVSITFHNPGTIDAFIAPTTVAILPPATGPDPALTPTVAAVHGRRPDAHLADRLRHRSGVDLHASRRCRAARGLGAGSGSSAARACGLAIPILVKGVEEF